MPKVTKKDLKKGKKVIKGKGGKGSGNIDIRLNVGTGTGYREPRLTRAEIDYARRRGIPLHAMRGLPFNYANQRRNPQFFGPTGTSGGGGLSGFTQQAKSPNLTEMLGVTGLTPLDVLQARELRERQTRAAAEERRARREARAAERRAQREAAAEVSPLEPRGRARGRRVFTPSPDRAGRQGGGGAFTVPPTSAATEARAQDRQEPAQVQGAGRLFREGPAQGYRGRRIQFEQEEEAPDPRAVSGAAPAERGGNPFAAQSTAAVAEPAAAAEAEPAVPAVAAPPAAEAPAFRMPPVSSGMGSVFVSRLGMQDDY